MTSNQLFENIKKKHSFLCVGLDTDINKIPDFLLKTDDPVFEFNKAIIEATQNLCVAYKINTAFYESLGINGWLSLQKTVEHIKSNFPDIFLIADAKRGDIGNTSKMYAKAFFEELNFDALTVAPYMGEDSIEPFLSYKNKWIILLALTSNKGANDFQFFSDAENTRLYERVIQQSSKWGAKNIMYVVGATKAEILKDIRKLIPDHFILVPGLGAQGGNLEDVVENGINNNCGLIVNSSRGIIYTDNSKQFSEKAKEKTFEIQQEMKKLLNKKGLL